MTISRMRAHAMGPSRSARAQAQPQRGPEIRACVPERNEIEKSKEKPQMDTIHTFLEAVRSAVIVKFSRDKRLKEIADRSDAGPTHRRVAGGACRVPDPVACGIVGCVASGSGLRGARALTPVRTTTSRCGRR